MTVFGSLICENLVNLWIKSVFLRASLPSCSLLFLVREIGGELSAGKKIPTLPQMRRKLLDIVAPDGDQQ